MKKLKWMILCMLVLILGTNIKASNCFVDKKEKPLKAVMAQPVNDVPATLIEQIFFPHGF